MIVRAICWTCHVIDPSSNLVAVRGWPHIQNGHPAPVQWSGPVAVSAMKSAPYFLRCVSNAPRAWEQRRHVWANPLDYWNPSNQQTTIYSCSTRAGKGLERAGKGLSSIYHCSRWLLLSRVHLWEGTKEGGIQGRRLLLRQHKKPAHVRSGSDSQRNMQLLHDWHHKWRKRSFVLHHHMTRGSSPAQLETEERLNLVHSSSNRRGWERL